MASTGITPRESTAFHRNSLDGKQLTPNEREQLLKPFLPPEPSSSSTEPSRPSTPAPASKPRRHTSHQLKRNTGLVRHAIHVLIYTVIHAIFSVFFRFRRAWRLVCSKVVALMFYHHRTPEFIRKDVKNLEKLPDHLSVILEFHENDEDQGNAGLEGLVNDVCELAAWSASVGIPLLSIYEKNGILKNCRPQLHASISLTLDSYFGPQRKPSLSLHAPHLPSYSPPSTPPRSSTPNSEGGKTAPHHLTILLLSAADGRETMCDLTKTLSDMAQKDSLNPYDITADLISAELIEAVSGEPDLLILFSPTVVLKGYPPWQLRLTEIFHLPDNKGVNYQVFIRALHKYAKVEMRLGK
ncbi:di-trans,poly-cis-decaprenylcistransferas-like protein [Zopfia rhizophila CBS 207.26]|uniref:ditrans,polycis-polyprenyl diphosphate synthase [(2E,6E)-farnesyldiphosphate specific] n=1 Tax=Zopfia rhizophila CBS 207.26 TaxID=1314779 RepID=A0A6A6E4R4_9PEZI|nr:di-trans,poly-cis-decaprenylcistransferas-like protein [Zopfia rhizophila CBS 207.26]